MIGGEIVDSLQQMLCLGFMFFTGAILSGIWFWVAMSTYNFFLRVYKNGPIDL